jgi:hypothetical protein
VEIDPDTGCNTYTPSEEAAAGGEAGWDEEDELEEWEEDEGDEDDEEWLDDSEDEF